MHLLENIAAACGCAYLSDLNYQQLEHTRPSLLPHCISKMAAERYPLREWQEAHLYITGQPCDANNASACKQSLINTLYSLYARIK